MFSACVLSEDSESLPTKRLRTLYNSVQKLSSDNRPLSQTSEPRSYKRLVCNDLEIGQYRSGGSDRLTPAPS